MREHQCLQRSIILTLCGHLSTNQKFMKFFVSSRQGFFQIVFLKKRTIQVQ